MAVSAISAVTGVMGTSNMGLANRLEVTIDGTVAAWNTVATHEVFTVTGMVRAQVYYLVTTQVGSAGAAQIAFGVAGGTGAFAAAQVVTGLAATVFAMPGGTVDTATEYVAYQSGGTIAADVILSEVDLGYEVSVAALNAGVIKAVCFWTPISSDGLIVAGTGAAL
jgi:ABC-type nitrate/sulfonate/bicarbonate transport system substrate-binding protein